MSDFDSLVKGLVGELEASQAVSARSAKKAELQRRLVSRAEKMKKNALNDIAILRERLAVSGTRDADLLSSASVASSQMGRASAELG